MTQFAYTAIPLKRVGAEVVSGRRDAPDERALREVLRAEGMIALEVRPVRWLDAVRGLSAGGGKGGLRRSDPAWFFGTLALLLGGKVPLEAALGTMIDLAPAPRLKAACAAVRDGLRAGQTLAGAVGGQKGLAAPQHLALLRSGQETGRLDHAVVLIDRGIATAERIRRAVVGKMIYPAILVLATIAALWFLATYVIPRFAETLAQLGGELPVPTAITLAVAGVLVWLVPAVAVVAIAVAATRPVWMTPALRLRVSEATLRAPVVGPLVWNGQAAMLTDLLATMLEGGGDLLSGMNQAGEVVTSPALGRRVAGAIKRVREGADVGVALHEQAVLPPMASALVLAGSKSGELTATLRRASGACMELQERLTARLLLLLEPAITVVMAGAIGWVIYSLVAGMLAMTEAAGR